MPDSSRYLRPDSNAVESDVVESVGDSFGEKFHYTFMIPLAVVEFGTLIMRIFRAAQIRKM